MPPHPPNPRCFLSPFTATATTARFRAKVFTPKPLYSFIAKITRAGLEVDHKKAFELHLKAANMGMPRAMFNTAVHYFEGSGVEQVIEEFRRFCWLFVSIVA